MFGTGLYSQYEITIAETEALLDEDWRIDGHCINCQQITIFRNVTARYDSTKKDIREGKSLRREIQLSCQRAGSHPIWVEILVAKGQIQKIGQYPSFADISKDEAKRYYKILGEHDAKEFSRAIGLATHGVGIGSFVYLRRIFERLIVSRFNEFKGVSGGTEEEFQRGRVSEKIEFLCKHLPEFLVRNSKVYGILSQGIHELSDEQCLSFFLC